jgi:hypothetical protein
VHTVVLLFVIGAFCAQLLCVSIFYTKAAFLKEQRKSASYVEPLPPGSCHSDHGRFKCTGGGSKRRKLNDVVYVIWDDFNFHASSMTVPLRKTFNSFYNYRSTIFRCVPFSNIHTPVLFATTLARREQSSMSFILPIRTTSIATRIACHETL